MKKRPLPPLRRYRRSTFRLAFLAIVLCILTAVIVCRKMALPYEPEKEVFETPPVYVITLPPKETPAPNVVPLSDDLRAWTEKQCGEDFPPEIVYAVIAVETGGTWDETLTGDNGKSFGLMQIYQSCHTERCIALGAFNLLDPYQNIAVGVDILKELSAQGKPLEWVLMAYNGGPGYADEMTERGEISRYAEKVLLLAKEYGL